MNQPPTPDVGLFTRFVLENPWPLGVSLAAIAAVVGFVGFREGLTRHIKAAAILGAVAAAIMLAGVFVETSGERAKSLTRVLAAAVIAEDLVTVDNLLGANATLSVGSPTNPSVDRDTIMATLSRITASYDFDDNTITILRGYSVSADEGEAHLACHTTVEQYPYPNASRWVVRVERQADGTWMVTGLTCVSINDRTPSLDLVR